MIRFSQVSKEYIPGQPVLHCADLHIERGEFVYIVGRSGAGKSTLLKLIFASELPSSGQVVVGGCDTLTLGIHDIPYFRRKIGVVYQDFKLLPRRTVFENVAFALEVVGRPQWEIQERVRKLLEEVGLLDCMDKLPAQLSGGEQQRVAIARALVRDPWILLADEPTGNLDPEMANEVIGLFDRAHMRGTTILVATHDHELLKRERTRERQLLRFDGTDVIQAPLAPSFPLLDAAGALPATPLPDLPKDPKTHPEERTS